MLTTVQRESSEECALGENEGLKESAWAKEQRCESAPPRAGQSAHCGTWIGGSHLVLSEMGPFVGLWENQLLVLLRVFLALFAFC